MKLHIIAALSLSAILAFSATNEKAITATGFGIDPASSLRDAQKNAVAQFYGISIESKTAMAAVATELSAQYDSSTESNSETLEVSGTTTEKATTTASGGVIKSYTILEVTDQGNGQFSTTIEAVFPDFKNVTLSQNFRRSIVIDGIYYAGDDTGENKAVMNDLYDQLNAAFTSSRRFDVLSRKDELSVTAEKNFLDDKSNISEQARFGHAMGADYLITFEINDFFIGIEEKTIQLTGVVIRKNIARVKLTYRLTALVTRQLKASEVLSIDFGEDELSAFNGDAQLTYDYIIKTIAERIANSCISNIYPLRTIRAREDGTVILAQGGALIKEGEQYNVFLLGEMDYDPVTKEPLGRDEVYIATIEITQVDPKKSTGVIINGAMTPEQAKQGAVCRKIKPKKEPVKTAPEAPKARPKVVLPFD